MQTLTEQIDCLLHEWEQARPEYNRPINGVERCFIRDGILNEAGYLKTDPKICFLLKETYGDFTDIVKTAEDLNGLTARMFSVMAQYVYVITAARHCRIYDVRELTSLAPVVNHIGYVEIKKVSGEPVSNAGDLNRYAERDADFLRRQLALIAPDIMYCAGTFEQCRYLYPPESPTGLKQIRERVYTAQIGGKTVYVIDYYHPAGSYGSYNELYRLLLQAFHGLESMEIRYDEKEVVCKTCSGRLISHQSIVPEHTEIELSLKSKPGSSAVCWTVNGSRTAEGSKPSFRYTVEVEGKNNILELTNFNILPTI